MTDIRFDRAPGDRPILTDREEGTPAGVMGIHLVFFLHITTGPDNTNNVLALAFGILIVLLVVVGSTVIMANLNENLMPSPEVMNLHMQH